MIKNASVEKILAAPIDEDGWHVLDGCHIKIGKNVVLGKNVTLGNYSSMGNDSSMGNYSRMGNHSRMGNYSRMDDYSSMGNYIVLPIYRSKTYSIHWYSPGMIKSGCIIKPIDWWLDNVRRCAEEHGYDKDAQDEYEMFVRQIAEWEKMMLAHGKIGVCEKVKPANA